MGGGAAPGLLVREKASNQRRALVVVEHRGLSIRTPARSPPTKPRPGHVNRLCNRVAAAGAARLHCGVLNVLPHPGCPARHQRLPLLALTDPAGDV